MTKGDGLEALDTTQAFLRGVRPAAAVTDAVSSRQYLHAGPPVDLQDLAAPMRGAVVAALLFEGEASTPEEAGAIIDAGDLSLRPCHEVAGVGAAAGVVSPGIPVVVAASSDGRTAFAPLHEGAGPSVRYGAFGPETLGNLRWLADELAPALDAAIAGSGPIELTALQAEGLRRGDECHNRSVASSAALALQLAPVIAAARGSSASALLTALAANGQFFLSFSMAAAKVVGDAAHAIGCTGLVTAIAANGRQVGIRVSGAGDRWFLADAPFGRPRILDGFRPEDASALMGDSFATEVIGLGAMAASAAPAISSFLGTDPLQAADDVAEMRRITLAASSRFLVPQERFAGTPLGIDVRKVRDTGIAPLVHGGFAHREAGIGMVGAGQVRLPMEPFEDAAAFLDKQE
jgi:hypothetical protein